MMHWLPSASNSVIFNDREGDRFVSVILNVHTGERRVLPRPITAISHDGKTALSLNFSRLQWARPGYGYAGIEDVYADQNNPSDDGIYLVDLDSGEDRRVVSLTDALSLYGDAKSLKNCPLFFNHALCNTDDTRFAFLIQWKSTIIPRRAQLWKLRKLAKLNAIMLTVNLDGSDLRYLSDFENVSHFDWRNSHEILMWAKRRGGPESYYIASDDNSDFKEIGQRVLREDGHCSFSPNRRFILTDTYPDQNRYMELKIYFIEEERQVILGRYYSPRQFSEEIRCDLHPRWNRTGDQICFDSVHEDNRQLYVMDVSKLTNE
jgi:hypothetical protein